MSDNEPRCTTCGLPTHPDYGDPHECPAGFLTSSPSVPTTQGEREHEHPRLVLSLMTRTRLIGTLNLAVALRGRSSGWGGEGRPRRWFVGFDRGAQPPFHRGIELVLSSDPERHGMGTKRTLLRVRLGSGITTWRFHR